METHLIYTIVGQGHCVVVGQQFLFVTPATFDYWVRTSLQINVNDSLIES